MKYIHQVTKTGNKFFFILLCDVQEIVKKFFVYGPWKPPNCPFKKHTKILTDFWPAFQTYKCLYMSLILVCRWLTIVPKCIIRTTCNIKYTNITLASSSALLGAALAIVRWALAFKQQVDYNPR